MKPSNCPLENLLREALKYELANRRGQGTVKRLHSIDEAVHQIYSNPHNWQANGVVTIIHTSETGVQTTLGVFQEWLHRRTGARRLERVDGRDGERVETIHGAVGRVFPTDPLPTHDPNETRAIREYVARMRTCEKVAKRQQTVAELLRELNGGGLQ